MSTTIHHTATVDEGCTIGNNTYIWHYTHICSGAVIGNNCTIGQNVYVAATVIVGHQVKIQNNVSLYDGVVCENDVFIGPSVVFTNVINPRSFIIKKAEYKQTVVQQGATIGANATILCGVTIGQYAMVGAGAVVTKSVPNFAVVIGNAASQNGWVSKAGNTLQFNNEGIAICTATMEQYVLNNGECTLS